jgi:hypothetical protein
MNKLARESRAVGRSMFEVRAVHFRLHAHRTVLNLYFVHNCWPDGLALEKRFERSEAYVRENVVISQKGRVKTWSH